MRQVAALGVLTAFVVASMDARATSSFIDLVGLGSSSQALDLAPGGDVAVGRGIGPWVWTESGGAVLFDSAPSQDTRLGGLSAGGAVIAGTTSTSTEGRVAFRWTEAGGAARLGPYPGGRRSSDGFDVSADGSVLVGDYTNDAIETHAFRWTEAGGVENLGTLPGSTTSTAFAVSDDASTVVGLDVDAFGVRQAFRWTAAGMVGLGTLPGSTSSSAYDVSLDGSVIVGQANAGAGAQAVRWSDEAIESLVPDAWRIPGIFSNAVAVDASGSVIGGGFSFGRGDAAFVWTADTGMQYLEEILTALGVDFLSWHLSEVAAISADGTTLAGSGIKPDGSSGAWLVHLDSIPDVANVPEPGTALLVILGSVGIAASQRRGRF